MRKSSVTAGFDNEQINEGWCSEPGSDIQEEKEVWDEKCIFVILS